MELGGNWESAIVAFGVVSGALNFIVGAINATMKQTKWYDSTWYARLQPWLPAIVGVVPGVLVGPHVVPVELPFTVHLFAGVLLGALSSLTYKVWEQSFKGRDARIEFAKAQAQQETPPALPPQ